MPIDSVSSARPSRAQRVEQLAQRAVRPRAAPSRSRRPARGSPSGRAAAGAAARRPRARRRRPRAGATPLLLASPLTLTCRQTCSGARPAGRCALSRSAIFRRSTRVHPVEVLGDDARLVALQRADQVPFEPRRAGRRARRSSRRLPARSSRRSGAGRRRAPRAIAVGAEGLAHGEQRDALHGASGGRTSACNARVHLGELVCDHCVLAPRSAPALRLAGALRHPLPEEPWTSPNCWRSRSRTRRPTCTCRPACRR